MANRADQARSPADPEAGLYSRGRNAVLIGGLALTLVGVGLEANDRIQHHGGLGVTALGIGLIYGSALWKKRQAQPPTEAEIFAASVRADLEELPTTEEPSYR